MKSAHFRNRIRKSLIGAASLVLLSSIFQTVHADSIPYPNAGAYNATTYSFTAASTGDIIAYFAGSTASYDNQLGMLVNGVQTSAGFGLDNHTSSIGQSFNLGHVTAGDILTFVLNIATLGGTKVYSDPAMNVAYDGFEAPGHNHIYASPYAATSKLAGIPTGTFVAFEDLSFLHSDYNYNDETFVFTNTNSGAPVPEPSTYLLLGMGLFGLVVLKKRSKC